jgi:glucose-1-phosphatase
MIRAIVFDFGNVICSFDIRIFQQNLLPYTSLSLDHLQHLRDPVTKLAVAYETGLMTSEEFFAEFVRLGGLSITREQFIHAYTSIFTPIEGTHELVRRLKGKYALGMLSNTNEWHFQYSIRPVPIFPLFDAVTLSYEVKAMKPARAIYDDMLRKLRVEPTECVYIDDLKENVEAAALLGMRVVHYTSHAGLLGELGRMGIEV